VARSNQFTILVIEEDQEIAGSLRHILNIGDNNPARIILASSLSEALASLNDEQVDLAFLDLALPDAGELEALQGLHSHVPELPVVVLVPPGTEGIGHQVVEAGALDFLILEKLTTADLIPILLRCCAARRDALEALEASEERFSEVVSCVGVAVYVAHLSEQDEWSKSYHSPQIEELTGHPVESFLQDWSFWQGLIHPQDRPVAAAHLERFAGGEHSEAEYRVIRAGGETIWVRDSGRVVKHNDGERPYTIYGVVDDISSSKATELALRESEHKLRLIEERYALVARATNDGLWDWNLQSNHVYYSARWKAILGHAEDEIGDEPGEWLDRVHPDDRERLMLALQNHLENESAQFEVEHRLSRKDSTYVWARARGLAVFDAEGAAIRIAGSLTDISQRKKAQDRLLQTAFYDALTGLPNRVLFMDRLAYAIEHTKRRSDYRFAVLFLDLDRFKTVNDSLGHLIGDELLVTIARRLEGCLRPSDTAARLGGDEFALLLEGIHSARDATRIAHRVQRALSTPVELHGHEVFTTASIGIALSVTGYERPEDVLRDADTAMYRAKSEGKARHQLFDRKMHASAVTLLQLESDLRRALDRQEFRVFYQPVVALESGRISGFEALLRWQHPRRGLLAPIDFLSVAEETGLLIPIGWWAVREACQQLRRWQEEFPLAPPLSISINLSSRQFAQADLVDHIDAILAETRVPPGALKLELMENIMLKHAERAREVLPRIRDRGIQLQMDNFGTGYASLNFLHHFSLATLKIDRSFVSMMNTAQSNLEIVRAICALAHNLDMQVVAEGIETEAHLEGLRLLKCEYGQGYFFAGPLDTDKASDLLASTPRW
jgi:diguanylate cyclase (GGDEF)-like protein/PAS domain S-box-containing protein